MDSIRMHDAVSHKILELVWSSLVTSNRQNFIFQFDQIRFSVPRDVWVSSWLDKSDDVLHLEILNDCWGRWYIRDVVDQIGDEVLSEREKKRRILKNRKD